MQLSINRNQYLELEKIALGAFSPLTGFMDEAEFKSVVDTMRLPDGRVFPLPVVMDVGRDKLEQMSRSKKIDLYFADELVGRIFKKNCFECDRLAVARKIFGTESESHPGVRYFYQLQPIFVGGDVELLKRPSFDVSGRELTPAETRKIFKARGWKRITGFQTRNVPHRAHEYLLRIALEVSDGLFIQPLVGHKKAGDYTPEAVLRGYDALIENYFPSERVVLGILSTVMRYAGPREAIFHAIVRRNYGCTSFIVGRDHAGVGSWYGTYDAHELARKLEDKIGIEILRLRGPYHCKKCDGIATVNTCIHEGTEYVEHISGTYMRQILSSGGRPDHHLMRQEVLDALKDVSCFLD